MNWLSNGKQPNGMIIRLQGFGNGLFGGNFHTHNILSFPPGLDVVCYSNGCDYVRGWRHNIQQAKAGRVVMSVDCTKLLNLRHVFEEMGIRDSLLMLPHPNPSEYITFDDVMLYPSRLNDKTQEHFMEKIVCSDVRIDPKDMVEPNTYYSANTDLMTCLNTSSIQKQGKPNLVVCIVTYGLGVTLARQAQKVLCKEHGYDNVIIIDTPCLSSVPKKLKKLLESVTAPEKRKNFRYQIVFADICKEMSAPLNNFAIKLQNDNLLQHFEWKSIAALQTYNLLGKEVSFLSREEIVSTVLSLK